MTRSPAMRPSEPDLTCIPFDPDLAGEADRLGRFLAGEPWPWHAGPPACVDAVVAEVGQGGWHGSSERTFWIFEAGDTVGVVRLFDLDDGGPMFDLRVTARARGRGVGTAAVRWSTAWLFDHQLGVDRVEATTRADNTAMRRALIRCGYAKEAHYRRAWALPSGGQADAVGYAILRDDWRTGAVTRPDWDDEPD